MTETKVLVDRAKDGDHDAFADLYRRLDPKVRMFVNRRMIDDPFAEDVVSAVWERVWLRLPTFEHQPGHVFGAWVLTIARHLVADHYKSGRYRLEKLTHDGAVSADACVEDPIADWVDEDQRQIVSAVVQSAVKSLREPLQREVTWLRDMDEMSVADTARRLCTSMGAVKAAHFRARRNLARALVGVL